MDPFATGYRLPALLSSFTVLQSIRSSRIKQLLLRSGSFSCCVLPFPCHSATKQSKTKQNKANVANVSAGAHLGPFPLLSFSQGEPFLRLVCWQQICVKKLFSEWSIFCLVVFFSSLQTSQASFLGIHSIPTDDAGSRVYEQYGVCPFDDCLGEL
jgi:hypothetical protein